MISRHTSKEMTQTYYYKGSRRYQMIHSRMRMRCSPLRNDLFEMHIINKKDCSCGHHTEDIQHYFFECPLYNAIRPQLLNVDPNINLDPHTILFGDSNVNNRLNHILFLCVTNYIRKSKIFK